ncbi:PepSY domain-containing protein [Hyphomicrobium sp.]|uniref:PepSY domain-containing protein n=1 Tax=Hyphomicrobium sp. TaxID=82 RepID=UPI003F6EDF7B
MIKRLLVSAAALAIFTANAEAKDRPPTDEERTKIETVLKAEGYSAWGKIELDDDKKWDVDDAVAADGKLYDLDISTADYKVLKKEPDTD